MGKNSEIAWTDHTQNCWVGCTNVSPGCDHCYAESYSIHYRDHLGTEWGAQGTRHRTKTWRDPYKWNEEAKKSGKRTLVFCSSLSDVFDNHPSILTEWREAMWQTIRETPYLTWQLLTKRPQNVKRYLPKDWGTDGYPNVWLGYTIENQEQLERRVKHIVRYGYVKNFFSCEPLLGELDLRMLLGYANPTIYVEPLVDWIICGGESGHGRRPMDLAWARSLRDQCKESGAPFFMKQIDKIQPIPEDLMIREFPTEATK